MQRLYSQIGKVEHLERDWIRDVFETNLFGAIELMNTLPLKKQGRVVWNRHLLSPCSADRIGRFIGRHYLDQIDHLLIQRVLQARFSHRHLDS